MREMTRIPRPYLQKEESQAIVKELCGDDQDKRDHLKLLLAAGIAEWVDIEPMDEDDTWESVNEELLGFADAFTNFEAPKA